MHIEKYHASGNDFLIIEDRITDVDYIKELLNNHLGIGSDGLIIYDHYTKEVEFYNKDGSKAALCGNGLRCLTLYVVKNYNLLGELVFKVGNYVCISRVKSLVPFITEIDFSNIDFTIDVLYVPSVNSDYPVGFVDFLNNHAILIFKDDVDKDKVIKQSMIYPQFQDKNISIIKVLNEKEIKISTYERGVGFTSSCGSASVCASIYLRHLGLINDHVLLHNDVDIIEVKLYPDIKLSGKVHYLFEVEYDV